MESRFIDCIISMCDLTQVSLGLNRLKFYKSLLLAHNPIRVDNDTSPMSLLKRLFQSHI